VSWWLRPHVITELGDITGLSNPRQLMRISAWSRRRTRAGAHAARAALLRVPTQSSRASCERSAATSARSNRSRGASPLCREPERPRSRRLRPRGALPSPTAQMHAAADAAPPPWPGHGAGSTPLALSSRSSRGFVAEGAEGAFQPSNQLPCRSWPCACTCSRRE
jgi:hypothetical protein